MQTEVHRTTTYYAASRLISAFRGHRKIGPDAQQTCSKILRPDSSEGDELQLRFFASELQLRGNQAVVQPHQEGGDVFCWNGEVCMHCTCSVSKFSEYLFVSYSRYLKDLM